MREKSHQIKHWFNLKHDIINIWIHNYYIISQTHTTLNHYIIKCVHVLYPLFDCPERLLRAGQSLIVTNNNARRSKCSSLYSSHTRMPVLLQKSRSSSTNGLRYTSMSFPGYVGPWMSTGIIMNFYFMHSHGGRL